MSVHFSSKTDLWATPQDLYDKLDKLFRFTLDVCATTENAKCEKFFTPEDNGLSQQWIGVCWMNPPYGREISEWVKKALYENTVYGTKIVMLLPARTDTKWFHNYIAKYSTKTAYCESDFINYLEDTNDFVVWFIKGRLKFGDAKNSAPFPSMVVVFR